MYLKKNDLSWLKFPDGIYACDAGYERPHQVAIHFIVEGDEVAIIDTGSFLAVENILAALSKLNLDNQAVKYILLTHVHLDHAGAAGQLMQLFPLAKLAVHQRGAKHMINPSKLIAGVTSVYGEAFFQRVYGDLVAVAEDRVLIANDLDKIYLNGREILCLDTPGHARHHLCYYDSRSQTIFSGDTFGLSYREMDIGERQFIFPTTSPVQFEPELLHQSIDRLMSYKPVAIYQTHYSRINFVEDQAKHLHRWINLHTECALRHEKIHDRTIRHEKIKGDLIKLLIQDASDFGSSMSDEFLLRLWGVDLELNTQGLGVWLDSLEG